MPVCRPTAHLVLPLRTVQPVLLPFVACAGAHACLPSNGSSCAAAPHRAARAAAVCSMCWCSCLSAVQRLILCCRSAPCSPCCCRL
ncbi:hypothetical protein NDU88_000670 [Pleurodeles waltl]|uniref:Secreted protein n=1 Tax=Pleurodeles waltl TaxID=8319 RepID=A0AAV7WK58_PLEWA|nr:hypothetical protein NDU88_000670 [Pleurodeles waltl]